MTGDERRVLPANWRTTLYGVNAKTPDETVTVAELAETLKPPLNRKQIRALITVADLQPVAIRPSGPRGGRPARSYRLAEVLAAHRLTAPLRDAR